MTNKNWLQKIISLLVEYFSFYNCEKGRHKWGYTLSDAGRVYLNDEDVPKRLWKCLECGIKKYN